jgi:hypothetical protein
VISRLYGGPGESVVANEVLDGTDMLGQLRGEGYAEARSLLSCSPHFSRRLRLEPHLGAVRGGVAHASYTDGTAMLSPHGSTLLGGCLASDASQEVDCIYLVTGHTHWSVDLWQSLQAFNIAS